MKQDSSGGYCPRCDTVWAAPGKCNCDENTFGKASMNVGTSKADAASVFEKEVWNAAIEAAALVAEINSAADIRRLKK